MRCAEKPFQTLSFSHDSQTCRDPMVFSFTTHSFAAGVISLGLFLASQSWHELNELPYLLHLIVTPVAFHLYLWYSNLPLLVSEHHPTTTPEKISPGRTTSRGSFFPSRSTVGIPNLSAKRRSQTWKWDEAWLDIQWVFPKIGGFFPPNHPGFSMIFTIHFGVPKFLETLKWDRCN